MIRILSNQAGKIWFCAFFTIFFASCFVWSFVLYIDSKAKAAIFEQVIDSSRQGDYHFKINKARAHWEVLNPALEKVCIQEGEVQGEKIARTLSTKLQIIFRSHEKDIINYIYEPSIEGCSKIITKQPFIGLIDFYNISDVYVKVLSPERKIDYSRLKIGVYNFSKGTGIGIEMGKQLIWLFLAGLLLSGLILWYRLMRK